MANPTVPFPFYSFVPDEDAAKLNQDFEALVGFITTHVVHRHHTDITSYSFGSIAAGGTADVAVAYGAAFPSGVVPLILPSVQTTAALGTNGIDLLNTASYAVTNQGCTVRIKNLDAGNARGGGTLIVLAFDPTFDTSQ